MPDLKYEVKEKLGALSKDARGWQKELNLVSWNDHPAKFDLREWSEDHSKMGKGITLTAEELKALRELLKDVEL
jgi:hypothetical protein